jgi:hypothetical protein
VLSYGQSWVQSFSDVHYSERRFLEDGDAVLMRFTGRGTNDAPWGDLPATTKTFVAPGINLIDFDRDGLIHSVEQLFDRLTVHTQLGHV